MSLEEPTEFDLEKGMLNRRLNDVMESLGDTSKEAKLRLMTELAEELSKYYNIELKVKDRKENELLVKKISLDLVKTADIRKWLDFT